MDSNIRRIGPDSFSPIAEVERDAGVSAQLRDGSVVWFFGDTAVRYPSGSLRFFAVGSAAWSRPGAPTVTLDSPVNQEAVPFSVVKPGEIECPPDAPTAGRWPLSAVVDRSGETDRVVLWMGNVCLGSGRAVNRGVSVGEWFYDSKVSPAGRPVSISMLNPNLFSGANLGDAAMVDPDGRIYVYGCGDSVESDPLSRRSRSCHVARVGFDGVGDPAKYAFWDGSRWGSGRGKPIAMKVGPEGISNPQGAFSVLWNEQRSVYLMAYSPWPGFVPLGAIRAADSPEGPWSAPTQFDLPDCSDGISDSKRACYGLNLQPVFSTKDRVGIGYSDRFVASGPDRGAFLVSTVGVKVDRFATRR